MNRRQRATTVLNRVVRSGTPAPEGKRRRRANNRRNRRAKMRAELQACRNRGGGGGEVPSYISAPTRAPMAGMVASADEYVPNENYEPALPALIKRGGATQQILGSLGSTRSGQMWALKALHPNGEDVTAAAGIPDHTNVPVTTPEFRANFTITGNTTETGNDDVDIIFPPMMQIAFGWRRRTAGQVETPKEAGWNWVYWPNLTKTNNNQPVPVASGTTLLPFTSSNFDDYGRSRTTYRGATIHMDAPTLADQGRLVAAQIPLEQREGNQLGVSFVDDAGVSQTSTSPLGVVVFPKNLPLNESDLFQASPGAIVWEARNGVYIPLHFADPTHLFKYDLESTWLGIGSALSGTNTTLFTDVDKKAVSAGVIGNTLAGIVILRGIDKRANINVKTRIGIETLIETANVLAPFQHASPILDQLSIDRVTQISQASPMAFPADYNDFGSILNVIKNVLSNIVKPISVAIGDLGLPVISDVANLVGGGLTGLGLAPRRRRRRAAINALSRL